MQLFRVCEHIYVTVIVASSGVSAVRMQRNTEQTVVGNESVAFATTTKGFKRPVHCLVQAAGVRLYVRHAALSPHDSPVEPGPWPAAQQPL